MSCRFLCGRRFCTLHDHVPMALPSRYRCFIALATVTVIAASPAGSPAARRTPPRPCADAGSWQIRLDQQGFSPGQLDGSLGTSTRHALAAFQDSHGLPASGQPDCATWHALVGERSASTLNPYTPDDVKGPYIERMPPDMEAAAKLRASATRRSSRPLPNVFTRRPPSSSASTRAHGLRPVNGSKFRRLCHSTRGPHLNMKRAPRCLRPRLAPRVGGAGDASRQHTDLLRASLGGSTHDPLPRVAGRSRRLPGIRCFTTTPTCSGTRIERRHRHD